jgi:uncharacterized protein YbjT (DUF2867 family)
MMNVDLLAIGAAGTIGSTVLAEVARLGRSVRVLVRNPDRFAPPPGLHAEITIGDLEQLADLGRLFSGIRDVFWLTRPTPAQLGIEERLIAAALTASVRNVVRISALGAAPDAASAFGRWHHACEQAITGSGLPFTSIQPHFLMQNLLAMRDRILSRGELSLPGDGLRIAITDARDVGIAALTALETAPRGILPVTGPEALSMPEITAAIAAASGQPLRYVPLDPRKLAETMERGGAPAWRSEATRDLYEDFARLDGFVAPRTEGAPSARPLSSFLADFWS